MTRTSQMDMQEENSVGAQQVGPLQAGVVCSIGPERRFGYVEAEGTDGRRRYIFVTGQTVTHRVAATLRIGTPVQIRVADDRRIVQFELD